MYHVEYMIEMSFCTFAALFLSYLTGADMLILFTLTMQSAILMRLIRLEGRHG